MPGIIVYDTKYGNTAWCATRIRDSILVESAAVPVQSVETSMLKAADFIVIGSPVYGGKILKRIPRFCERNKASLLAKSVGLFICCFYEGEKAYEQLNESYPDWLLAHADVSDWLGGRIEISKLSFLDRFLVGRLGNIKKDVDQFKEDRIVSFCKAINVMKSGIQNL